MERTIYIAGASDYRVKMGSKTKTYHVNMLKKYFTSEHEVDVVYTSNNNDTTTAAYWQIPVAPDDVYKTAFVTQDAIWNGELRSYSGRKTEKRFRLSGVGSYIDDSYLQ